MYGNVEHCQATQKYPPLEIGFPSIHHSPSTVNKNASEFVIGVVSESSTRAESAFPSPKNQETNSPAFPTNKKNHRLPVMLMSSGRAYFQFLSRAAAFLSASQTR